MAESDGNLVLDQQDHDELIRHLGAAVIACWSDLPREIQDRLLAGSGTTDDEIGADDLDARLRLFVGSHLRSADRGEPR